MKQLLFLLLFPCLALAQYPGNGNQKITLGEQTSADGLVYRGLAADTTRKPSVDTMAYILLDTNTNIIWQYKKATNNAWTRVGGSISSGLTGVLPVANGGTGRVSLTSNKLLVGNNTDNIIAANDLHWNNSTNMLGIGEVNPTLFKLSVKGDIPVLFNATDTRSDITYGGTRYYRNVSTNGAGNGFQMAFNNNLGNIAEYGYIGAYIIDNSSTSIDGGLLFMTTNNNNTRQEVMRLLNNGNVGIGTNAPAVQFHTTGAVRFAGLASITDLRTDADGDLYNGSDFNLKNSIDSINFGLADVLKLKPVSFNWNDEARNINEYKSMGFIAQDIMDVIPNAASTMGDGDMQVDYNAIVATLTKAIQEQNALIKALEQRILILENK